VCGKCGEKLVAAGATAPGSSNGKPQVVTDATFANEVLKASASLTVLVDCWAVWCGPCHAIAPVLDQLAAESRGRYKIAKLNVDENPHTSGQFHIRSIPTLLIFRNGQVVDTIVGAVPKQTIAARLAAQV
jgi:thioredoxin